jgi:hypothetical protein
VADTADINGGTIDGTTIGAGTPSTGAFTTLSSTTGANFPAADFVNTALLERSGRTTDARFGAARVLATKTTDMGDGFGAGMYFSIRDDAAVINSIAAVGGQRDGADNSGALILSTYLTGTENERLRITSTGNVGIGTASPGFNTAVASNILTVNGGSTRGLLELASDAADADQSTVGQVGFFSSTNTLAATKQMSAIVCVKAGSTAQNRGGEMRFLTKVDNGSLTERMRIDGSGNVGIGTATPATLLDVGTSGASDNYINVTSSNISRLRIGYQSSASPSNNVNQAQIFADSNGEVHISSRTNNSSGIILYTNAGTTASERMRINSAGAIKFNAYGAGAATFDASGNITSVSDERIKKNIRPFSRGLSDIICINPILHGYTTESKLDQTRDDYAGFSAQQVQAFIPEAIGVNADGMLSFSDRPIMAALVNAVKELTERIAALESK